MSEKEPILGVFTSKKDILDDFFDDNDGIKHRTLAGYADLRILADMIGVNHNTLKTFALKDDFPAHYAILSGIMVYDVSKVARYMQVSLNGRGEN